MAGCAGTCSGASPGTCDFSKSNGSVCGVVNCVPPNNKNHVCEEGICVDQGC